MPRRIRLRWNRSQDKEVEYYRVFRSENPRIEHEAGKDNMIMKVKHPRHVNPLTVYNEIPKRLNSRTFKLKYNNIVIENNGKIEPFIVHVDDHYVDQFLLDRLSGEIIFDYDIPLNSKVVVKQYSFDGVEVWDYGVTEDNKTYYGPEAKDTSAPSPPTNLSLEKDTEKNRIILRWSSSSPTGKVYYYRIDAAINDQKYSRLSETAYAVLQEPLADRPYHIERSEDGIRWMEIAKVKGNEFYEYMIDRQPPSPVRNLKADLFMYRSRGMAQIVLKWDPIVDMSTSKTAMYRVRTKNRAGMISAPSEVVGPIDFKVNLDYILIRRKINDGILPSFDGSDAITVAKIYDTDATEFIETVHDNTEYMYGIWVVDEAGNYSTLTYTTIFVHDATAPSIGFNVTAEEFHHVTG